MAVGLEGEWVYIYDLYIGVRVPFSTAAPLLYIVDL